MFWDFKIKFIQEFIGCKKLFKQENIYYKSKFGKNKASFAEWGIFIIKKRLYMMLRGILNQNWVHYIPQIVKDYNKTPSSKLGGITPESIHSEVDSVRVKDAQKKANINVYQEPNYSDQLKNQIEYESNLHNLQIDDYVFLSENEPLFSKSYDVKVKFFNSK